MTTFIIYATSECVYITYIMCAHNYSHRNGIYMWYKQRADTYARALQSLQETTRRHVRVRAIFLLIYFHRNNIALYMYNVYTIYYGCVCFCVCVLCLSVRKKETSSEHFARIMCFTMYT